MLGQWETQGMILGDNSMVRGVCSGVEMEPSERNRHLQRRRRVGGEGEELRWLRSEQRKRGRCRYGVPPPLTVVRSWATAPWLHCACDYACSSQVCQASGPANAPPPSFISKSL